MQTFRKLRLALETMDIELNFVVRELEKDTLCTCTGGEKSFH